MDSPVIYQMRIVLRGISPLIWRRLHIASTASITDLHYILQITFNWDGDHLHRFHLHGREYGIAQLGGMTFRDDPTTIVLHDFRLHLGERFWYEYNLGLNAMPFN